MVYAAQSAVDAYAIVHIPHVTGAEPDRDALTHASGEEQRAFAGQPDGATARVHRTR
jgi:hypothetical protein